MQESRYQIASWRLDLSTPVLRGATSERHLEERAGRTLALLCRRRGEIVSKDELIAAVWNGRSVGPNRVSIPSTCPA